MGCVISAKERAALARSKEISRTLRQEGMAAQRCVQLLLLGGKETQRKTICQQMQSIQIQDKGPECSPQTAPAAAAGVMEVQFSFNDLNYKLIHVGGQRWTQTRKWFHCFEHVSAIIYCVDMAEYGDVDEMRGSLQLFDSICNNRWFMHTTIVVLFLNKGLLEEKSKKSPLTTRFPEYGGAEGYEEAVADMKTQFEARNKSKFRHIHSHIVSGTEASHIHASFAIATDAVLAHMYPTCEMCVKFR